jgi:hypothetical protein
MTALIVFMAFILSEPQINLIIPISSEKNDAGLISPIGLIRGSDS